MASHGGRGNYSCHYATIIIFTSPHFDGLVRRLLAWSPHLGGQGLVGGTRRGHGRHGVLRRTESPTRHASAAAAVPVAAPSANKFGHVSPTTAQHVWDDLQNENVWILEEQHDQPDNDTSRVGVESSVVKLEMNDQDSHGTLTVLRQGAVSVTDLQAALQQVGLSDHVQVVAKSNQRVTEVTATVAPGQTIRHYSPNVPSYLLSAECVSSLAAISVVIDKDSSLSALLANTVILDYGKTCATWQGRVLAYRDLSPSGDSAQAAQGIYDCLRWAEQVPQAKYILFPSLLRDDDHHGSDALLLAVQDRLTRAASGVVLDSLDTLLPSSEAL